MGGASECRHQHGRGGEEEKKMVNSQMTWQQYFYSREELRRGTLFPSPTLHEEALCTFGLVFSFVLALTQCFSEDDALDSCQRDDSSFGC